jgi:hypothetical protein
MQRFVSLACASLLFAGALGVVHAEGKVVDYIEPKQAANPAPAHALHDYQRFEVRPITMDAPYAGQDANEEAKKSIQANFDERLNPVLAEWNAKPAGTSPHTLLLEPHIEHVKFISGGRRFWGGAFAGGSAVLITMKITDETTGEVVAEPEFYQHANKMAGAWSFGATDKAMLIRVAGMMVNYLRNNYDTAVGGSTTDAGDVQF